jgi:hypothetical protein
VFSVAVTNSPIEEKIVMKVNHIRAAVIALAFGLFPIDAGLAAQGSGCMPTTGTISGLVFAQDVNAAIAALISSNSGASAPATDCTATAVKGQVWLDTSTTPNIVKQYDGSNWTIVGYLDASNHLFLHKLGLGTGASLLSGSTVDLGSVPQTYVSVTGSMGSITSFGASATIGDLKIVVFTSTPTVTNNAISMILPSAADITVGAGDVWMVAYLGSGNWRVLNTQQASGLAVVNPAVPVATKLDFFGVSPPPKFVLGYGQPLSRSTYPDYFNAVSSVQSATRTSSSRVLTSLSDTSFMGINMPVEGTGIPAGALIASVDSPTQITLDSGHAASSSGTSNITIVTAGYGSGGSNSTVGVPDCRGRTVMARSNMGGTDATSTLSSNYYNGPTTALFSQGGAQSHSLITAENGPHTHLGTTNSTTPGSPSIGVGSATAAPGGSNTYYSANNTGGGFSTANIDVSATAHTHTFTTASSGSGQSFATVTPGIIANCIVRVLSSLDLDRSRSPPPTWDMEEGRNVYRKLAA